MMLEQQSDDLFFIAPVQTGAMRPDKDALKVGEPQGLTAALTKLAGIRTISADGCTIRRLAEILAAILAGNLALLHVVHHLGRRALSAKYGIHFLAIYI